MENNLDENTKKNIQKTGTTVLGIVCKDGIVMAGDRQSTMGQSIVADKKKIKVYPVNDYLVFAGTGVASDAQRAPKILRAELKLKELKSKSRPTVKQAANLLNHIAYSNIRQPSIIPFQVGSLLAGYNPDGTIELYTIEPAGTIGKVEDYDANVGSGMPYVLGLLERQWKENMSIEEGIELAKEAIKSSSQRDTASGFGIDVYKITSEGIEKVVEESVEYNYKKDVSKEKTNKKENKK